MRRLRSAFQPPRWPRLLLVLALAAALLLAAAGLAARLAAHSGPAKPRVSGDLFDRSVPALPLLDAAGKTTSLAAFRGKVVVLTPFLTLCHEVCPLTTGAYEMMQHAVEQAGLGTKVAFLEVSVDPWRDTPARLRAFARLTGVDFHLLTGTQTQLARFWRFFGVAYWKTKEGKPPDLDWLTHKPLTFDVSHTDALFVLDPRGHERILDVGMPAPGRNLPSTLLQLLNATGRSDLAHPKGGWTVQQGLDDVGYLLGRRIPAAGGV